jgi:hypothetical protein
MGCVVGKQKQKASFTSEIHVSILDFKRWKQRNPLKLLGFKGLPKMAEREGFEPSVPFRARTLSKRVP